MSEIKKHRNWLNHALVEPTWIPDVNQVVRHMKLGCDVLVMTRPQLPAEIFEIDPDATFQPYKCTILCGDQLQHDVLLDQLEQIK